MKWETIREQYPHQWTLIEATEAHSEAGKRILDDMAVINVFENWNTAMKEYARQRRQWPERELLVLHTDREHLEIHERRWVGVRAQP